MKYSDIRIMRADVWGSPAQWGEFVRSVRERPYVRGKWHRYARYMQHRMPPNGARVSAWRAVKESGAEISLSAALRFENRLLGWWKHYQEHGGLPPVKSRWVKTRDESPTSQPARPPSVAEPAG